MYVPAVLRPTQHPPRSKGTNRGKDFTPPGSLESVNAFEAGGLQRSSTAGSATSSWGLGRVGSFREGNGVCPSREHWKVRQFFLPGEVACEFVHDEEAERLEELGRTLSNEFRVPSSF